MLAHLATRIFDAPLLIAPQKLEIILAVVGPRMGLQIAAAVAEEPRPQKAYEFTPDGIAVIRLRARWSTSRMG